MRQIFFEILCERATNYSGLVIQRSCTPPCICPQFYDSIEWKSVPKSFSWEPGPFQFVPQKFPIFFLVCTIRVSSMCENQLSRNLVRICGDSDVGRGVGAQQTCQHCLVLQKPRCCQFWRSIFHLFVFFAHPHTRGIHHKLLHSQNSIWWVDMLN